MVTLRSALRSLYVSVAIAGATAGGGPAAGTAMATFLRSPAGKRVVDAGLDRQMRQLGLDEGEFARGGLVVDPTLALIGEDGPELILPLSGLDLTTGKTKLRKTKSKAKKAADKKMSQALKRANKELRTKSGKLRKGATQSMIMKRAQKYRRKMK